MKNKEIFSLLTIFAFFILALSACQSSAGPEISIEDVWGRPSPKVASAGAFYMLIKNNGNEADTLISASSDSCGAVELHESYDAGDGVMGMREVEGGSIEIPSKGEIELKMGGLHIMCINKLVDFDPGVILPLSLEFDKSGTMLVDVEIRNPNE